MAEGRSSGMLPRRSRLGRRGAPLGVLAGLAFLGGAIAGGQHEAAEDRVAEQYARAFARLDFAQMRDLVDAGTRDRLSLAAFTAAHRDALAVATATAMRAGRVSEASGGAKTVPMTIRTRVFGTLRAPLRLEFVEEGGETRVRWGRELTFPGVRRGERLRRRVRLAERAPLLARDGTPLVRGDAPPTLEPAVAGVVGQVGPAPPERAAELEAQGVPPGEPVGLTGLERALQVELAGRPGGTLLAGPRILARTRPRSADAVRTSIDLRVQRAAIAGLGSRLGGVAVVRPRTGEVLALAGIAFSGLQPPGSTFKIVTISAALEAGVAKVEDDFPVQTAATLSGVELENANGESCGGSLRASFAHSCNSVFAPMGAELGAERLVRMSERFGFNERLEIPGAATSTIPPADEIGDDLAVGSTAIGQGRVQATALQMALISATIANRGLFVRPTLERGRRTRSTRAIEEDVARTVGRMMLAVVREGTGTAAAISGVLVAGKTGTAELEDTSDDDEQPEEPGALPEPENDPSDTDAWFTAYAPHDRPRAAVGVLLVRSGAGGDTAAPVARQVLQAALGG